MTRTLLEELAHRLQQDFSAANLDSAATLAHEASWNSNDPVGLFVITSVLHHLEGHWDVPAFGDQAWMTTEAKRDMESRLRPPLLDYLAAASASPLDPDAELGLLNRVIRELFRWIAEGPDPRPA